MSWIDQLERVKHPDGRVLIGASFRGVPFFVDSSTRTGGRRYAKKEFIEGEIPKVTDLGKVGNKFTVEGYVLGADYMIHRDALLSSLQDIAGPGSLVHPYFGRGIRVQCGTVTINETKSNGGIATFTIELEHAPRFTSRHVVVNLNGVVESVAAFTLVQNRSDVNTAMVIAGQPAFALESLSEKLTVVTEALKFALSPLVFVTQELAKMTQRLDILSSQASSLVRTPGVVVDNLSEAIQTLVETVKESRVGVVNALLDAFSVDSIADALGDTPARVQERLNQVAFSLALRIVLVSEASRIAIGITFVSIDDAIATRTRLVDAIDVLVATAGIDTYPALVSLRSSVLRAIPGEETLARISEFSLAVDTPSLVIAYERYGSTDREQDLVARNKRAHPGFMSGDLKVLTDA